jgi:diguanylate cyclase (GGDEF)-like protein
VSADAPNQARTAAAAPPRSGIGLIRELHGSAAESTRLRSRNLIASGFDEGRGDVVRLAVEACGARLVSFEASGATGPAESTGAVDGLLLGPSPNPATLALAAQQGWEQFDEETFTAICRAVLTHRTKPTHAVDAQLARAREEARSLARNGSRPPAAPTEEEILRNVEARRLHLRGGDAKTVSSTAARAARGAAGTAPPRSTPILRAPAAPPRAPVELPTELPPRTTATSAAVAADAAVREERGALRGAMLSEWRALRAELAALRERVVTSATEARTDPLTGLANRRLFEEDLPALHEHATETGRGYAVVFIDLDHFGELNKARGHETGDEVLRAAAASFAGALGDDGSLYRIGGEEFVVIAPGATAEQAAALGERLRSALLGRAIRRGNTADAGLVTASIGVAALGASHGDHAAVVRDANQAMLGAKSAGRDRVAVSEPVADAA